MLLKGKHIKLKMKQDGTPVEPRTMLFLLDFSPNHYDLPVIEEVYNRAVVGLQYEIDIVRING